MAMPLLFLKSAFIALHSPHRIKITKYILLTVCNLGQNKGQEEDGPRKKITRERFFTDSSRIGFEEQSSSRERDQMRKKRPKIFLRPKRGRNGKNVFAFFAGERERVSERERERERVCVCVRVSSGA